MWRQLSPGELFRGCRECHCSSRNVAREDTGVFVGGEAGDASGDS